MRCTKNKKYVSIVLWFILMNSFFTIQHDKNTVYARAVDTALHEKVMKVIGCILKDEAITPEQKVYERLPDRKTFTVNIYVARYYDEVEGAYYVLTYEAGLPGSFYGEGYFPNKYFKDAKGGDGTTDCVRVEKYSSDEDTLSWRVRVYSGPSGNYDKTVPLYMGVGVNTELEDAFEYIAGFTKKELIADVQLGSLEDELNELDRLLASNEITNEKYEKRRQEILLKY